MGFRAMLFIVRFPLHRSPESVTKMLRYRLVDEFQFSYNLSAIISFRVENSGGHVIATHQYLVAVIGAGPAGLFGARELANRSEERRVGKACRTRSVTW